MPSLPLLVRRSSARKNKPKGTSNMIRKTLGSRPARPFDAREPGKLTDLQRVPCKSSDAPPHVPRITGGHDEGPRHDKPDQHYAEGQEQASELQAQDGNGIEVAHSRMSRFL